MTINDLINNKTTLTKCNAETVYKIAKALDTSVEELIEPYMKNRPSFELFKSNVCHLVKTKGDLEYIVETLEIFIICFWVAVGSMALWGEQ